MKIKKIKIKSAYDLFKQPIGEPFEVENLKFEFVEENNKDKTLKKKAIAKA